ncbi:hypothetical protein [Maribacter hydrothermalis]|uniref:Uncharacterized protein n=1 Tax=Maribacter hydrothermalis TaxID=1836467 RepID=A0A1B7ZCD7_9FLAO|nr:hypothetical protein [Maribacter hydrothermalis]APQ18028.1 hypothetical protein BTR34_12110 [Maribacter hydrothermalis]OBR40570.1 hypothetical protein A9200_15770 [Maribacter hydrothermalis]
MQSHQQKELQFLAQLGERKIKSIKTAYELTESELAVIIRLHQKSSSSKDKALYNLLNQF